MSEQEDEFNTIIDPETNKEVPLQSAIGTQIIKNYLECLKNGPESKNIVSTKMMYKNTPASSSKSSEKVLEEKKWQMKAEKISTNQYDKEKIYDKEKQRGKRLTKGSLIWVQRSNKKWQQAIIYETCKKGNSYFVNTFINCNGKVGRKKNIGIKDIIIA